MRAGRAALSAARRFIGAAPSARRRMALRRASKVATAVSRARDASAAHRGARATREGTSRASRAGGVDAASSSTRRAGAPTRALASASAPWYAASPSGRAVTLLCAFASATDRGRWDVFGDFEHGGASACELVAGRDDDEDSDDAGEENGGATMERVDDARREALRRRYSTLRGRVDCAPPPSGTKSRLKRSGFAGARTKPLTRTLVNPDPTLDFDAYDALSYRVRGDGRMYVASVRTENWMTGDSAEDVWQAAFRPPKDEWVDVVVPIEAFVQTHRGRAVRDHSRMSANRVVFLGLAVAGSAEKSLEARRAEADGPFRLDVHSISGLRMTEEELEAHAAAREGTRENYPCGGFAARAVEALDARDDFVNPF